MNKIILLGIAMILLIANVSAFSFNMRNITVNELKNKIDLDNSTARMDFEHNLTYVGYQYRCKYDNQPTATFDQTTGTLSVIDSNLEGKQMQESNGDADCNPAPETTDVNFTAEFMFVNYPATDPGWTYCLGDACAAASVQIGSSLSVADVINYYDGGWLGTGVKTGNTNKQDYAYAKLDMKQKLLVINNLSSTNGGYFYKIKTNTATLHSEMFRMESNSVAVVTIIDVVKVYNSTPNYNMSANVTFTSRQTESASTNQYDFYVYSNVSEKELNLSYGLSCNNGTNWVYSQATNGATNKTTLICSGSQTSNDFIGKFYILNKSTQWYGIYAVGSVAVVDTTPPEITLINLTGEGGLGYIIFNNSNEDMGNNNGSVKTNDTTPTFFVKTNENANCSIINLNRDLNYSDIYKGNANNDASAGTTHILTLNESNKTRIGVWNFSIGCTDTTGNQNRTSTSGNFTVNITDPIAPNITLFKPLNKSVFLIGTNNTNIMFNWSATDNYDVTLKNCSLFFNGTLQHNVTEYINNTLVNSNITIRDFGYFEWFVNCTDQSNNKNQSNIFEMNVLPQTFQVNVTLLLNGTNTSKRYEYDTTLLNKDYAVNLTILVTNNITTCVDYDYLINWTCGENVSIYSNITELNITRFRTGNFTVNLTPTSNNVSITLDNNTDIVKVGFKIKGYLDSGNSFPTNVTFDIDRNGIPDIIIPGYIRGNEVEINEFKTSLGANRQAQNLTYITAGSNTIIINASSDLINNNFTMKLSGYDIDNSNAFNIEERFNISSSNINDTLSFWIDSPTGVFDSFVSNNSKWSISNNCLLNYFSDSGTCLEQQLNCLRAYCASDTPSPSGYLTYSDISADMRNSSYINLIYTIGANAGSGGTFIIYATDGTNNIELYALAMTNAVDPPLSANTTIERLSSNDKIWKSTTSWVGTQSWEREGIRDLSGLDFSKQIYLKIYLEHQTLHLYNINWSGIWLNYSDNNGTYKQRGNYTSKVINVTKNNVTRATLTWYAYEPTNTKVTGYLSNTCGNASPVYDSVQNGVSNIFSTFGNIICARFNLNSSINTTSPIVRKYRIDIVVSNTQNITIIGPDGIELWNYLFTLNSTTSPKTVNGSMDGFNNYKSTNCNKTPTCNYPISISAKTSGILAIDSVNFTQRIISTANSSTEIIIKNLTKLENATYWDWMVNFTNGILQILDLDIEFKGSKNITLFAHSLSNITHLQGTRNLTFEVYYSKFNSTLATGKSTYNIFPSSKDSKNVTPFGQSVITPIWNITTYAYDLPFDIYVRLNNTINCTTGNKGSVNVTYSNTSNKSDGVILNTTFKKIISNVSHWNFDGFVINESINITINGSNLTTNTSIMKYLPIISEKFYVVNSSTNNRLNRNADYTINFTTGNFTLYNSTYNITKLLATYNYTAVNPSKGLWNWWDFDNCTKRFVIPYIHFQPYCQGCVTS